MREILFRGKRADNGEWIEGYVVKQFGVFKIYEDEQDKDFGNWINEVDPETIGQYTGLEDKNGKKIFEGDKVVIEVDCEEAGTVVWDKVELEWGIDSETVSLKMGCFYSREIEVLGNIYEREIPKECYEKYGEDLDGCSTQENEGCGRCSLAAGRGRTNE